MAMLMGLVPWGFNTLLWYVGSRRADAMLFDKTKGVLHEAIEVGSSYNKYVLRVLKGGGCDHLG